ncbi:MAG: hypothetical protein GAK30_01923 [Paracidovorax wautersii]|uniref:Type IV pilus assembly protein PilN n=1 Tax=Paracidovorax wautersii TaxID=1177982 RepID=A0A7V8FNY3_9BURK|nr:MAG: hypothetical protein GAK30_01923 [Paracidovorax wautersii]
MRFNLLPHREQARRQRAAALRAAMVLALLLGAGGALGSWGLVQWQTARQQARNAALQAEAAALDTAIAQVAALRRELAVQRERLASLQALSDERNRPVHLLNELAQRLPDGVYLTRLRQQGRQVALAGAAQSNAHLAELLRSLGQGSQWLLAPQLGESAVTVIERADGRRAPAAVFTLTLQMREAAGETAVVSEARGTSP